MQVVHVDRLATQATAAMAAGSGVPVQQVLDDFDRELNAEPVVIDREAAELRRALGVA